VVSEIFVASGKRMDNPMLSVDFLPGGVMVGGVRNGIISVCDSALDSNGTPVCTENPQSEVEPIDEGCGCASAPSRHPAIAMWLLLALGCMRRARRQTTHL